jgi:hypothetical protein
MMMSGRWRLLLVVALVAVAAFGASSPAFADSPVPPISYKRVSPGGGYVFVMMGDPRFDSWGNDPVARQLRQTYSASGLYRNDGSTEPLWTVDWYAHKVDVASDGVHLVRHGPWAMATSDEAVSFFANGQLVRSYIVNWLVDDKSKLSRSVSQHFTWELSSQLDDARLEYSLQTVDGNTFTFDVSTGQIVSENRPSRSQ